MKVYIACMNLDSAFDDLAKSSSVGFHNSSRGALHVISPKVYLHTFDRYSQTGKFEAQNEAYMDKFDWLFACPLNFNIWPDLADNGRATCGLPLHTWLRASVK